MLVELDGGLAVEVGGPFLVVILLRLHCKERRRKICVCKKVKLLLLFLLLCSFVGNESAEIEKGVRKADKQER